MTLTWQDLIEAEPRLIRLEERIKDYKKLCKNKSSLEAAWHGWNLREISFYSELDPANAIYNKTSEEIAEIEKNGRVQFQRDLARLVGMKRRKRHWLLTTRNAYRCAYDHLHGLLIAELQRATRVRAIKTIESHQAL
jgi:hypothetical protein